MFHVVTEISLCISTQLLRLLVSFLHVLIELAVCPQQLVPPSEGGGVVAHKVQVMEVVETAASIEWDQVKWVPRDVITTGRKKEKYSFSYTIVLNFASKIFSTSKMLT